MIDLLILVIRVEILRCKFFVALWWFFEIVGIAQGKIENLLIASTVVTAYILGEKIYSSVRKDTLLRLGLEKQLKAESELWLLMSLYWLLLVLPGWLITCSANLLSSILADSWRSTKRQIAKIRDTRRITDR